jgi:hypothetical protein
MQGKLGQLVEIYVRMPRSKSTWRWGKVLGGLGTCLCDYEGLSFVYLSECSMVWVMGVEGERDPWKWELW